MTKREEIKDGAANIIANWFMPGGLSGQTMPNERSCIGDLWEYLNENGVVIKKTDEASARIRCGADMVDFVAVESIIGGVE